MLKLELPPRSGERPRTSSTHPYRQLTQRAPVLLQRDLREHALGLPGVRAAAPAAWPGAPAGGFDALLDARSRAGFRAVLEPVALVLDRPFHRPAVTPRVGRGWGQLQPPDDGSAHLHLPAPVAGRLVELGWAEHHPVVVRGLAPPVVVLLYGPRDEAELAVARAVLTAAYVAAGGARTDAHGRQFSPVPRVLSAPGAPVRVPAPRLPVAG